MQLIQMKFPNAIPKTEQLQFPLLQFLNSIIAILQMQLIQMKFPNAIPKTEQLQFLLLQFLNCNF